MSDDYGFDGDGSFGLVEERKDPIKKPNASLKILGISAAQFGSAITKAFAQAATGGKQFDDVLKGLALKLSGLAVQNAFKPIAKILAGDFRGLLGGDGDVIKNLTPFASGGIINTPSYFPLSGGLGLAGEAGPEAIVPLSRGADGRLGIAGGGGGQGGNITVHIATPDPGSFQRSEAYITGQIARAVARGQRGF